MLDLKYPADVYEQLASRRDALYRKFDAAVRDGGDRAVSLHGKQAALSIAEEKGFLQQQQQEALRQAFQVSVDKAFLRLAACEPQRQKLAAIAEARVLDTVRGQALAKRRDFVLKPVATESGSATPP